MVHLRVLILATLLPASASVPGSDGRGTVTPPSAASLRTTAPPPGLVAAAADRPASGTVRAAAADLQWAREFVARQYVVDGTASSLARVDPHCRTGCELSVFPGAGPGDFGTLKAVSGIDVGIFSMSGFGLEGMIDFRNRTADGTIAGARVVLTWGDIETARENGEYAYVFYVQSRVAPQWQLDGDLSNLRRWYAEGLRVLQLRYGDKEGHEPDERLAYGSYEGDEKGVTELGRRAIAEMNRLGMIVDVSHLSRQSTLDAAALSNKPVLASHANAEALTPQDRTKDDDELRAIAATGGVIGVTPIGWMLDRDGDGKAGMEDMVAHVEYIAGLVGIDHVGLSTDAALDGWDPDSRHYADAELAAFDRWVRLTAELHARGWSEEDLTKLLGGNFLRVFREVLSGC
ncbi:MAG: membrane dipeptidase [Acidobacteriota bacterium]|nr:membrane dipeptidase [Acidobacteriota bacterium]